MIYAVHQDPDGMPVGVWDATDSSYYPPQYADRQRWGASVMSDGSFEAFPDYAQRISESVPSPSGGWDAIELPEQYPLPAVYDFAVKRTS